MTASRLVFCRYDFFPELLILKFMGKKFILLSAANKKPSWFKNQVYSFFDIIVASTKKEAQFFKVEYPKALVFAFDFRIPRIFDRSKNAATHLLNEAALREYINYLDSSGCKKCIFGSAWPSDLTIFKTGEWQRDIKKGSLHLLIVPHQLSKPFLEELSSKLKHLFPALPLYELSREGETFNRAAFNANPGIVILNMSGVLCELYTKFPFAYIGGGYERSIHSVLEPFLSGSSVFCGPLTHRSTEYDAIVEMAPNEIHLLNNPESFYTLFSDVTSNTENKMNRQELSELSNNLKIKIIKEIANA